MIIQPSPVNQNSPTSALATGEPSNQYSSTMGLAIPIQMQALSQTGNYAPTNNSNRTYTQSVNAPQQNSSGQWINTATGTPYHGTYVSPSGQQTYYSNGKQVQNAADVGVQTPNLTVTQTAKNPAIASQVAGLTTEAGNTNSLMSKSFNDYLNEANTLNQQGASQLTKDQAAVDPTATDTRLNTDSKNLATSLTDNNAAYDANQSKVLGQVAANTGAYNANTAQNLNTLTSESANTAADLKNQNSNYAAEQAGVQSQIAGENQSYATSVNDRLANLQSSLTAQDQAYQTAAQNVAAQAYQQAQKQIALYQLGSGTATSGSGNLDNRYINAYTAINVPLQQQLAQLGLSQTEMMNTLQTNAGQQLYGNQMNQYAGQSALNSDIANRGTSLDQYLQNLYGQNYAAGTSANSSIYGANNNLTSASSALNSDIANRNSGVATQINSNDAQTAQQIQSLALQTAGMSRAQAQTYLQQLGIPITMAAQVLNAQTQNLAGVNTLDQSANNYTFSTPYNASSIPQSRSYSGNRGSYTPSAPSMSNVSIPQTNIGDTSSANAFNAQQQAWLNTAAGQAWLGQNGGGSYTSSPAVTGTGNGYINNGDGTYTVAGSGGSYNFNAPGSIGSVGATPLSPYTPQQIAALQAQYQ